MDVKNKKKPKKIINILHPKKKSLSKEPQSEAKTKIANATNEMPTMENHVVACKIKALMKLFRRPI